MMSGSFRKPRIIRDDDIDQYIINTQLSASELNLLRSYTSGFSGQIIAENIGCHKSTIYRTLRDLMSKILESAKAIEEESKSIPTKRHYGWKDARPKD